MHGELAAKDTGSVLHVNDSVPVAPPLACSSLLRPPRPLPNRYEVPLALTVSFYCRFCMSLSSLNAAVFSTMVGYP